MPYVWRTRSRGPVEVQGLGVPTLTGDARVQLESVSSRWGALAELAARRYGIARALILGIMNAESGGNPNVESSAGAVGLMQLMPMWWGGRTKADMMQPQTSIDLGARLLGDLWRRYGGDVPSIAAAYNAGAVYSAPDPPYPWGMKEDLPPRAADGSQPPSWYVSKVTAGYNTIGLADASAFNAAQGTIARSTSSAGAGAIVVLVVLVVLPALAAKVWR